MKSFGLILLLMVSCSVIKREIKIENHTQEVLINQRQENIKTSFSVLIVGAPWFSSDLYLKTLGHYLAKVGGDVWILIPEEKGNFPIIFSTGLMVITTYTKHDEVFIICHGFTCLPTIEFYKDSRIKGIFMISPPLFSWEWSEAFKWFVSKYEEGRKLEEIVEEIPPQARNGVKTFELLFGEKFSEEEKKFIKSTMKTISPDWIEFIKSYIEEEKTEFIERFCKIEVPSIAVAGQGDGFIPFWTSVPPSIHRKKCKNDFWFFGRANFNKKEYAHLEMFVGEDAKDEVFPYIYKWLKFGWKKSNWMRETAEFP